MPSFKLSIYVSVPHPFLRCRAILLLPFPLIGCSFSLRTYGKNRHPSYSNGKTDTATFWLLRHYGNGIRKDFLYGILTAVAEFY